MRQMRLDHERMGLGHSRDSYVDRGDLLYSPDFQSGFSSGRAKKSAADELNADHTGFSSCGNSIIDPRTDQRGHPDLPLHSFRTRAHSLVKRNTRQIGI